jgi:hypothetical protein
MADILIELAQSVGLFHSSDSTGYADILINGHRETWPIRGKGFRRWLTHRYYEATAGAPSADALSAALNVIEARAQFDGPQREVFVRVAGGDAVIYLDLADESWRVVEIDVDGWRVIRDPPVRFRRTAGMQPLPVPALGGSIDELRSFLNVRGDRDFVLAVAWSLAALRDRGPYPILVLTGEQGSAKSTFAAVLRSLIDPNLAPLRALPREDRDLFIAANNTHVLAFDNLSRLPWWISDTLCRLATGGGFSVRQLYTDQEEVLFNALRPVILNGIEDIVDRPDLADRALFLNLEPIPDVRRQTEAQLNARLEAAKPKLLGALLEGVSHGLRHIANTRLDHVPRMADFAAWATSCEAAWWVPGTFADAYIGNRNEVTSNLIEADSVGAAIIELMSESSEWSGTATELLAELELKISDSVRRQRAWPKAPHVLSGRLRRLATYLRKVGIDTSFTRKGAAGTRTWELTRTR